MSRKIALITGASKGIGAALALEYAAHNYDLILVARDRDSMRQLAERCKNQHGSNVMVIAEDLAKKEAVSNILKQIESSGMQVDTLINNAGFGYYGEFIKSDGVTDEMVQVNVLALANLTQQILAKMLPRKTGKIINIASVLGFMPIPYQTIYSATKAFVIHFSFGLSAELENTGIKVCCVCPGGTESEFHARAGLKSRGQSFKISAKELAKMIFDADQKDKFLLVPKLYNKFFIRLIRLLPFSIQLPAVNWVIYKLRKTDYKHGG